MMENNIVDLAVYSMKGQMEDKNQKEVAHLCKSRIHKMLCLGLEICNMIYKSKITKSRMLCLEPKHMRASWIEDCGVINIK
jgi:hypothetical protein